MANPNCSKCGGKGVVKEKDGSIHTCFNCLLDGNMDQHDAHLKDAGVKV